MVEYIDVKDIEKQKKKEKAKKFFSKVKNVAATAGRATLKGTKTIAKGTLEATKKGIKKVQEASTPEARERRMLAEEKRLMIQERISKRRQSIQKIQGESGSPMSVGGNLLGGTFSNAGSGFDIGANLVGGMGLVTGITAPKPVPQIKQPTKIKTRFKTVKSTKFVKIKKGKGKGKFIRRTTTRRIKMKVKRLPRTTPVKTAPAPFDPFSQF